MNYFSPRVRKKKFTFLKQNEVWYTVLIGDIFTIPLTLFLGKFKTFFTPNAVSSSSFTVFFISVACMFLFPENNLWYTIGFFLVFLIDGTDGKLARHNKVSSEFGGCVDAFFDMLNQGLGLALVGLAINLKTNQVAPFFILLPYSMYLAGEHMRDITNALNVTKKEPAKTTVKEGKWHKFCDNYGLSYNPYSNVEIIFIAILLIGINLKNPSIFLFLSIYIYFIPDVYARIIKNRKSQIQ